MKLLKKSDWQMRLAWLLVLIGGVNIARVLAQAQAKDIEPVVRLGSDVWIMIGAGLVTVGINLQQLRQTRADVREIKITVDAHGASAQAHRDDIQRELLAFRDREAIEWRSISERLMHVEGGMAALINRNRVDPIKGT